MRRPCHTSRQLKRLKKRKKKREREIQVQGLIYINSHVYMCKRQELYEIKSYVGVHDPQLVAATYIRKE